MICPRCGAPAVAGQQLFCQECGAALMAPPTPQGLRVVGDGGDQAMRSLKQQAAYLWMEENKGRLLLWAAGVALAVVALTVVIITVLSVLIFLASAALPVVALIVALHVAGARRRRRRRWLRPY